jgi:hypothetical protein
MTAEASQQAKALDDEDRDDADPSMAKAVATTASTDNAPNSPKDVAAPAVGRPERDAVVPKEAPDTAKTIAPQIDRDRTVCGPCCC